MAVIPKDLIGGRVVRSKAIQDIFWELVLLVGFGAVTYGTWQIYRPAAWVICGLVLMAGAWRACSNRQSNGGLNHDKR